MKLEYFDRVPSEYRDRAIIEYQRLMAEIADIQCAGERHDQAVVLIRSVIAISVVGSLLALLWEWLR
jgi:hypothetical protein